MRNHRTRAEQSDAGFTLVELMIVIGIMSILLGIYVQNAMAATEETRAMVCEKNRVLYEDAEQIFEHRQGRPSEDLQELVESKVLNKATCPRGGLLTWEVIDETLNYAHQSLVCSIHGKKTRIRSIKDNEEAVDTGPTGLGAGFEDGTFGAWLTLGATSIVAGADFGTSYDGENLAYVDTNSSWSQVIGTNKIATFLGVSKKDLNAAGTQTLTGGSAIKIEAGEGTGELLRINFLTSEGTPTYWYNDIAVLTISNATTGKTEVHKIADTYSTFSKSATKFNEETGWKSLSDLGIDAKIEAGDTVGFAVLNGRDKAVSSAILIDEGK